MGLLGDIKSLFTDDFKNGVEQQTSKYPIIYIDPNQFDRKYYTDHSKVNPDDIKKMRETLESQMPGFTKNQSDNDIKDLVEASLVRGPFAGHINNEGKDVCLVNTIQNDLKNKNALAAALSSTQINRIKNVPGWEDHWERVVGIHEGQHCNQQDASSYIQILAREAESDQAAIDWLKENKLDDIAQAFVDYRALGAASGHVDHATSLFLNLNGQNPDGLSKITAASSFKEEMLFEVMLEKDISYDDAQKLMNENPKEFAEILSDNLKNGSFKRDNPYVEAFVKDYVEGIQRTGVPVDAEKNIENAIDNLDTEMMFEVMQEKGLDYAQALKLREDHPEEFAKIIEDGVKDGHFDRSDNPYYKEYISSYIGGFKRQVVEAKPDPVHHHASADTPPEENVAHNANAENSVKSEANPSRSATPSTPAVHSNIDVAAITTEAPKVDLADDIGTSMKIGGVSAAAYFASFADPNLAEERASIALNAPVIAASAMENKSTASFVPA